VAFPVQQPRSPPRGEVFVGERLHHLSTSKLCRQVAITKVNLQPLEQQENGNSAAPNSHFFLFDEGHVVHTLVQSMKGYPKNDIVSEVVVV
jgi:hypothetical protein